MQRVARQLERIRRAAKVLLVVRSVSQCVAALLATAMACALLDYGLRLPGWLRLGVDVVVVGLAARWLAIQLRIVWGVRPSLAELALRAERLFPQLAGVLASGVELATASVEERWPAQTSVLAESSIEQARQRVRGVRLRRLIRPSRPIRAAGLASAMAAALACAAWAAPDHAALAAKRWLTPLGGAEWPRRTHVQSTSLAPVLTRRPILEARDIPTTWLRRGRSRGQTGWPGSATGRERQSLSISAKVISSNPSPLAFTSCSRKPHSITY